MIDAAEQEYDNPTKDLAWTAFLEGYDLGKHVEELQPIYVSAAQSEFEQWWKRNT